MKVHFNEWLERMFAKLANLSFGIYLIHIFIMRYVLWECDFIQNMDSYIVQTITIAIIIFVLSAVFCYLISLLPFASSIIGYKEKKA